MNGDQTCPIASTRYEAHCISHCMGSTNENRGLENQSRLESGPESGGLPCPGWVTWMKREGERERESTQQEGHVHCSLEELHPMGWSEEGLVHFTLDLGLERVQCHRQWTLKILEYQRIRTR